MAIARAAIAALSLVVSCGWFGESDGRTPVTDCASLAGVDLVAIGGPGSAVDEAVESTERGYAACHVRGTLAPSVGFEVVLPVEGYTGRLLQVGCRGFCGRISFLVPGAEGCAPFDEGGLALATTDGGHEGPDAEFGASPQGRIDFAHRAVHVTAQASKALVRAFYGKAPEHSYFSGCGEGGREGVMAALRHPGDFDGIVAGAPRLDFTAQVSVHHAWQARSNQEGELATPILRREHTELLAAAVLEACDELDGLKDGIVSDPRGCHFNPTSLQCAEEGQTGCLTSTQAIAASKLYRSPVDPATGLPLLVSGALPGSELAWEGMAVPRGPTNRIFAARIAANALHYLLPYRGPLPAGDIRELTLDAPTFDDLTKLHGLYDASDPDIGAFLDRGGKLVLWHGWADPHVSPLTSIAYYDAVEEHVGAERAREGVRLFLFPGMHHCYRGSGPQWFDLLTPLFDWVEQGRPVDSVVATQGGEAEAKYPLVGRDLDDIPERSRPVYAYPQVARYRGSGSVDEASSFEAAPGERTPVPEFVGRKLFEPGPRLDCVAEGRALACEEAAP